MRKYIFLVPVICLFFPSQTNAQNRASPKGKLAYPDVPRITAQEAYMKYKVGKAIIVHAGPGIFEKRHIMGAFNIPWNPIRKGQAKPPNLPKNNLEILTYCY